MEKIDTEVSPMAAANNFYYKSLPELQKLAEGYKSPLRVGVSSSAPVYTVEDVSREEFHNITTFLYNASVKDSKLVSSSESDLSSAFSSYLKKYMEEGLTLSDVVGLKNFVTGYNGLAFSHLYNNVYGYVYGVSQETAAGIDPNSFYGRIVKDIKDRLSFVVSKTQNNSSKTAEEWLTGSDTGISARVYTASEFLDYIQKSSGIIEAVVLLEVISYINKEDLSSGGGAFEFDGSSVVRDSSINLTEESFFDLYEISTVVKDLVFLTESASVVESAQGTNTLESIRISDSLGRTILTLKYRRLDSSDNLLEQYLFVTPTSGAISFTNLISAFRSQLNTFVNAIKLTPPPGLTAEYEEKISYFLRSNNDVLLESILADVRSSLRTIFYKDTIIESQRIGLGSGQKLSALPSEISSAQAQNQILIIDARNVDFSTDATALAAAELAFGSEVGDLVTIEEATEESEAVVDYNKVTYTVIYKELNQALRPLLQSEVQDYVLSRMVEDLGVSSLLQVDGNGVSYDEAIENLFRAHRDSQELFKLGPDLSRYRFFYGNGYNARRFAESEIIGYYIGNSTSESAFTNNYGRYDYQRAEIRSFLDTYRTTRDYYYRVLLNKSFIQDSAYPVYEKLFIAWAAIERFLSSKIDNLRDPDLFNDTDIFNFLESYGLGVLNQYDFSLPNGRNYKTNIIKYFNQLIRLKGSKDVIPLLARVFDVDDATLEVKKFLLVDAAASTYPAATSYDLELARDYEIWLKTAGTWAALTLSADKYFYSETDSLVYFYDHDGTGLVWSSGEPFTGTSGSGAPSGGSNGDYYLRTGSTSPGLYEKISGVWTSVTPSTQSYFYSETDSDLYVYTSSWDNGTNGIVGTSGEATPTDGSNGDYYLKEGKIYVLFEESNTDIVVYDPGRIYYYDGDFVYSDGSAASVSTDYVFDEQTFVLYSGSTLTEADYTFVNRQPEEDVLEEDQIVFDEITETFYIGVDNAGTIEADEITSITMVSVVDTLPASTQDRSTAETSTTMGSVYYSTSTSKFYEKTSWGWDAIKASPEYPEVISSNIGLTIPSGSSLSEQIRSYDENYFYQTDEITGLPSSLLQFNLSTGSVVEVADIPFETTESLPSRPGEIDVKLGRLLIKEGVIARSYLTASQPVEYSPVAYILDTGADSNRRFLDINSKISSFAPIEDGYETPLYVQPRTVIGASDLRFVEVPYSSDNGTREINNSLNSGIPYEDFVSKNVADGTDPYWTLDNVPASTLEGLGLDAVETKYLSLTISENVYRNYAVSRYLLSAIERLESAFKIDTDGDTSLLDETPVTSRIFIDSGVVGESTLYDFFQAAKVLFKANVAIYSAQGEDFSLRGYDSTKIRYYGVNPSADWDAVVDTIRAVIPNFDDIEENFLEDEYKASDLLSTSWGSTTAYDKFSLYQKTDNPIDYGSGRAYRKDLVVDGEKQLNTVSGIIRDVAFSTIKLNQAIQQHSSGELALETIENLNTIRLENDLLWDYFLSKYYNDDYSIIDAGLRSRQLSDKLPEASELYYKVIEDMIRFPIQVFDGLLNESYSAQNKNLSKDFVDFATVIFDEVYTQEARKNWEFASSSFGTAEPSSANKGEYFYNTDDDELFIYSGSSWGSALTIKATGTHGLTTPANSSGTNGDYFLNITNDVLYRKVSGSWTGTPQSFTFGDIFVDTTEERVIVCLPEDPALFSKTSFSNASIQEYVSDALDILNGVTPVPTSAAELETLAESFTQKLLSLSDSLESIFSSEEFMRLKFSLSEAEQQTISFVETSVRLFLSYTSQLYSSRYKREFNTQSESAPLSDRILHTLQGVRADYVLYDEKLDIEKEE